MVKLTEKSLDSNWIERYRQLAKDCGFVKDGKPDTEAVKKHYEGVRGYDFGDLS